MKVTQIMLMALLMSVSYAWNANYTPSTSSYSVLSGSFSLLTGVEPSWTFGGINTTGLTLGEAIYMEDGIQFVAECDSGFGNPCTDTSSGQMRIPWGANNTSASLGFYTRLSSTSCSHGTGSWESLVVIKNSTGSAILSPANGTFNITFDVDTANLSNSTSSWSIPRDHYLDMSLQVSCSSGAVASIIKVVNWTNYSTAHSYIVTQTLVNFTTGSPFPNLVNFMGAYGKVGLTASGYLLYSEVGTGGSLANTASACPTYLYFSSTAIQPAITYFPSSSLSYPNFFNATTGEAWIMNNTITYVLDDTTRLWYVVPAFTCDPTLHYTSAVLYYATANGTTSNFTAPLIPNNFYCNFNGSIYNVYSSYTNPVTHTVYYNNGTNFNSTSQVSSDFSFTVNTVDYSSINYTVNGNTLCSYSGNATGIFPNIIPLTGASSIMYKYIGILLFIFALAISTVVPFGLIFVVLINDFFQYVGPGEMVGLCIVTAFVAFFNTHKGFITLKTIAMYACIGAAILAFYYGYAGFSVAPLNNITNSFNTLTQDPQYTNLPAMVYAGAAFIIQFVTLIITLPALLIDALMAAILAASPAFYNALHSGGAVMSIENALKIAFLAWVYLKGYEVLANRYNLV